MSSSGIPPLQAQRRLLIALLVGYCVLGTVSQKMVPGVDEIFPFFGWSLFSRVVNEETHYSIRIESRDGSDLSAPVGLLTAPDDLVRGNRYIARKVVQHLGRAIEAGDAAEVRRVRRNLERNYLVGDLGYSVVEERYQPLEKWRHDRVEAERRLGEYRVGQR